MTQVIVPTLIKMDSASEAQLRFRAVPQLKDCYVFANPHEEIQNHPSVLDFFEGRSDKLAVDDLGEFCRVLSGANSLFADGTRGFVVGQYVLEGIPPEEKPSLLEKAFAKIAGKDLKTYFDPQDRLIIDDFLTQVMTAIEPQKICIRSKAEPIAPAP